MVSDWDDCQTENKYMDIILLSASLWTTRHL